MAYFEGWVGRIQISAELAKGLSFSFVLPYSPKSWLIGLTVVGSQAWLRFPGVWISFSMFHVKH